MARSKSDGLVRRSPPSAWPKTINQQWKGTVGVVIVARGDERQDLNLARQREKFCFVSTPLPEGIWREGTVFECTMPKETCKAPSHPYWVTETSASRIGSLSCLALTEAKVRREFSSRILRLTPFVRKSH